GSLGGVRRYRAVAPIRQLAPKLNTANDEQLAQDIVVFFFILHFFFYCGLVVVGFFLFGGWLFVYFSV
ncbi:hypothetical protein, partial [Pseudomonas marginalis]|uniref:hypothetical protein n=1 Tax=Pseudomonas marginalis TaxID=298 RepID=UPI0034D98922